MPDFVEKVQKVAEHVYSIENGKLGWRAPKSDGRRGGGRGKTDVYLAEIGGSLFGYAAPDKGQASKDHRLPRHLHGYLVLDNDYDPFEFPGTTPIHDLEVTFAHEYNHILQFGYDAYQDAWFAESTATWMEDEVYNGINDYLRYVHRWDSLYDVPMTATTIKEYGSAVWNHWLVRHYGRDIIRQAWAGAIHVTPGGFSVGAYDRAIRAAGGSDFDRDFARFAADVAEWRTDAVFPEGSLYQDAPAAGEPAATGRGNGADAQPHDLRDAPRRMPRAAAPWSSKRRRRSGRLGRGRAGRPARRRTARQGRLPAPLQAPRRPDVGSPGRARSLFAGSPPS